MFKMALQAVFLCCLLVAVSMAAKPFRFEGQNDVMKNTKIKHRGETSYRGQISPSFRVPTDFAQKIHDYSMTFP